MAETHGSLRHCTPHCSLMKDVPGAGAPGAGVRGLHSEWLARAPCGGWVQVQSNPNPNFGYNAGTGTYEDLMASGIIDPAKVTSTPHPPLPPPLACSLPMPAHPSPWPSRRCCWGGAWSKREAGRQPCWHPGCKASLVGVTGWQMEWRCGAAWPCLGLALLMKLLVGG